jgi:hypothetical protein
MFIKLCSLKASGERPKELEKRFAIRSLDQFSKAALFRRRNVWAYRAALCDKNRNLETVTLYETGAASLVADFYTVQAQIACANAVPLQISPARKLYVTCVYVMMRRDGSLPLVILPAE